MTAAVIAEFIRQRLADLPEDGFRHERHRVPVSRTTRKIVALRARRGEGVRRRRSNKPS